MTQTKTPNFKELFPLICRFSQGRKRSVHLYTFNYLKVKSDFKTERDKYKLKSITVLVLERIFTPAVWTPTTQLNPFEKLKAREFLIVHIGCLSFTKIFGYVQCTVTVYYKLKLSLQNRTDKALRVNYPLDYTSQCRSDTP